MTAVVESLLGHGQVDMALLCLGSLLRCSLDPVRLRLRDDGTLTEADRGRLAVLGGPEVIDRRTADEQVEAQLRAHPASFAYRRRHPLGLKLFDVALGQTGDLHFCDTDVLFLRPVKGLFTSAPQHSALFLRDSQNAYSLRSWQLTLHGLRLPEKTNTGLFTFPRQSFDLDLVEWYLSRSEMAFAPMWQEQTAWALLAGRGACWHFDPQRFRIPSRSPSRIEPKGGPVALHFVTPVRDLLRSLSAEKGEGEASVVDIVPARRLRPIRLLGEEIQRRLARS